MSNLRILSRHSRRPSKEQEKETSRTRKPEKSESGAVVEMKLPIGAFESIYLYGSTLLMLADGRVLFDKDGTPVLSSEYYHVTAQGISRVA